VLELDSSELVDWLASPSDVDRLRASGPVLVIHDDGSASAGPGAIRGLVTVAAPSYGSAPDWATGADVDLSAIAHLAGGDVLVVLDTAIGTNPQASVALVELLRLTEALDPTAGLIAESATYSMLQSGNEHTRWLEGRRNLTAAADRSTAVDVGDQLASPVVSLERADNELTITLDHPQRHNAYSAAMRDALVAALELAATDASITLITLHGAGPSFCSGGDLDEFGTAPDPATAHRVRIDRSAAALLWQLRDRVRVEVHGACIGAGIELAAVAGHISADATAWFALPEVSMGLVPGAGGTVSVTRRIGRQRCAWMALTGARLDVATAHSWGLVDVLLPTQSPSSVQS
jgi:enoyl-CoA hydratase/carnithine racemase